MDDHLEYPEFPLPDLSEFPLPDMSEVSLALSPLMDSFNMDVPVAFDPSLIPANSSQFASGQFASEDPPSARLGEYIQRFQASGEVQIPEAPRGSATDPGKPFACGWVDPRRGACDRAYGRECDLTKHQRNHTRPIPCPECPSKELEYRFPEKKELYRHMTRAHADACEYWGVIIPDSRACPYHGCRYTSPSPYNLSRHQSTCPNRPAGR